MITSENINWWAYDKGQEAWKRYLKQINMYENADWLSVEMPKNPYKKNTISWYSWNRGWNSL